MPNREGGSVMKLLFCDPQRFFNQDDSSGNSYTLKQRCTKTNNQTGL